ncbi:MAG: hypothetical protein EPO31_01995 [Gammaproteobacteria bacterium]|jgi:hypothetical protein|nr:MAG: hypothetical protein EPO31_01995 [Gammaproteobacteria bacterium]
MKHLIAGAVAAITLTASLNATAAVEIYCDRACLAGFMNKYLEALVKHDAASLPVTRNVKYTENGVRLNLGDGMWQTAAALPTYRLDVIDETAGQVGLLGRIDENGNNNWYAVRLKVEMGKQISEIETLINRSITGGGGFGGAPNTEPHPLMMQQIPEDKRLPRATLAEISDTYFTGLDTEESGRNVPFSPDCQRRENGTVTSNNTEAEKGSMQWMDCKAQFDTGFSVIVTDIRERRFAVVDPVTGLAFGWGYFDHNGSVQTMSRTAGGEQSAVGNAFRQPFSFYIAEVFKVVDGNIRQIEAVLTTVPYQMESGW